MSDATRIHLDAVRIQNLLSDNCSQQVTQNLLSDTVRIQHFTRCDPHPPGYGPHPVDMQLPPVATTPVAAGSDATRIQLDAVRIQLQIALF